MKKYKRIWIWNCIDKSSSRQLADAAAYVSDVRCMWVCTHQIAAPFCVKWRHGRHLEIENLTPPIDRCILHIYLKNNPAKFNPDPTWNDGALGFFWSASLQLQQQEKRRKQQEDE